ncbi:MAG: FAD-dependent oxidoreductase [Rhodospirillales bacterium]|nr:FAD-dependent oxidoreductase [Rhodospirillales bacterium]
MADFPTQARVVVIGGGAVGCSALYHLARMGWTDTVLLEGNELTSGSTWHAAGNCPNFSTSWSIMKLQRYSTRLYQRLGAETNYPINYHVTGAIRLAHTKSRMEEFLHVTEMARHQGIVFEMLSPADIKDRYPFITLDDLRGGQWDPDDGDIDPAQLTQALARGATSLGAKIVRFCPVTGIHRKSSGEWQVQTGKGDITAEIVVNAGGYRAAEVGAMVGRDVPCVTLCHQYLVTEQIPDLASRKSKLPLLRDPDDSYYLRQERSGLIVGPYERNPEARWLDGVPDDFAFQLFPDDLERLAWHLDSATRRVPLLASAGIQKVINGPIPYTPDGNPLIGPAPGLQNFYECCVFSFGIVQAGGAGKALAEWVVEGETEWDLWSLDPRRFTGHVGKQYTKEKALELYRYEYAIGFPYEERPAGRPAKVSPLYERLKAKGAQFGARNGWERATWFPRDPEQANADLTFHRPSWLGRMAEECQAAAEGVAVLELPGFSRFEITGRGAAEWLETLICGNLPRPGRVSLAYACTPKGGLLSEFTITRLDDDRFWLLGASTAEWHDRDWLVQRLPADGSVHIENVTARYSTLVVTGPKAREVLGQVTDADLSSNAFPWLSAKPISVGIARGTALRVSYVGELGWELHMPLERLVAAYDAVREAGQPFGIRDIGIYAVDSLRLEKCYRSWKQDLEIGYSPLAASLDRFVNLKKPSFPGREALLSESERGPKARLVPLIVAADTTDAPFCSTVFKDGERAGIVTSGGYGHRLRQSIALAYIRSDLAGEGTALEIEIFGRRVGATVKREPLYDPENLRLRA